MARLVAAVAAFADFLAVARQMTVLVATVAARRLTAAAVAKRAAAAAAATTMVHGGARLEMASLTSLDVCCALARKMTRLAALVTNVAIAHFVSVSSLYFLFRYN